PRGTDPDPVLSGGVANRVLAQRPLRFRSPPGTGRLQAAREEGSALAFALVKPDLWYHPKKAPQGGFTSDEHEKSKPSVDHGRPDAGFGSGHGRGSIPLLSADPLPCYR